MEMPSSSLPCQDDTMSVVYAHPGIINRHPFTLAFPLVAVEVEVSRKPSYFCPVPAAVPLSPEFCEVAKPGTLFGIPLDVEHTGKPAYHPVRKLLHMHCSKRVI